MFLYHVSCYWTRRSSFDNKCFTFITVRELSPARQPLSLTDHPFRSDSLGITLFYCIYNPDDGLIPFTFIQAIFRIIEELNHSAPEEVSCIDRTTVRKLIGTARLVFGSDCRFVLSTVEPFEA